MNKKLFIESLNNLEKQYNVDVEFSKTMGKAFPNAFEANLLPNNHLLVDTVIKLLGDGLDDHIDWIGYYCFELDFGKNFEIGMISDDVDISTPEKLWDFLYNNLDEKN